MKIAILGTRGIPASYGGFEQCAEKLSVYFVSQGHETTVYNPDDHSFKDSDWQGIHIQTVFSKESTWGALSPFIFDYLSLKDAINRDFDIILELGYSPAAFFYDLNKEKRAKIVTNMAGIEWARKKWGFFARQVIKYSERLAVRKSDVLISDNPGIRDYIFSSYTCDSVYIPYGAEVQENVRPEHLEMFGLRRYSYYMLMARLQTDNNIEMILDGYALSKANEPFIVVGGYQNRYGKFLRKKYKSYPQIRFLGGIYDYSAASALRHYAKLYFHGHSVGGTNPSLLEAMASSAYIAAHNNTFNHYVLGGDAWYFSSAADVAGILHRFTEEQKNTFLKNNLEKIKNNYCWNKIGESYLELFKKVLS